MKNVDDEIKAAGEDFEATMEKIKSKQPGLKAKAKKEYVKPVYTAKLTRALNIAVSAHEGQTRRNGLPYVIHPIAVMGAIADMGITDEDTLIVGLLHDLFEDTDYPKEQIRLEFGDSVADDVEALSFYGKTEEEKDAYLASFKNKSVRANVVKSLDRVVNTRDFQMLDPVKARAYWKKAEPFFDNFRDGNLEEVKTVYSKEVYDHLVDIVQAIFEAYSLRDMLGDMGLKIQ